ncbi:MAG: ATP-dependent zinc protease [Pseudomonadales bacterium]|nr:ATP-dependent zinc protease [Pseudomonadales bacterium]
MATKKRSYKAKTIIGWREWCELEKLGLPGVAAKIDTGAKTSSLHAFKLNYREKSNGTWVDFYVHPVQRHKDPQIKCKARVIEMRSVVSSNGQAEKRPVIKTRIILGPHSFLTEITLTNRDEMGYRMLIGRQSLAPRFIVDSSLSWALGDRDENELYPGAMP